METLHAEDSVEDSTSISFLYYAFSDLVGVESKDWEIGVSATDSIFGEVSGARFTNRISETLHVDFVLPSAMESSPGADQRFFIISNARGLEIDRIILSWSRLISPRIRGYCYAFGDGEGTERELPRNCWQAVPGHINLGQDVRKYQQAAYDSLEKLYEHAPALTPEPRQLTVMDCACIMHLGLAARLGYSYEKAARHVAAERLEGCAITEAFDEFHDTGRVRIKHAQERFKEHFGNSFITTSDRSNPKHNYNLNPSYSQYGVSPPAK